MSAKPFDIMRWEAPNAPTAEFLGRMLVRDGLQAETLELAGMAHTPEEKFDRQRVLVSVNGKIQVSFPGYGSVNLVSGDTLEIHSGVLHDIIVQESHAVQVLQAFK